MTNKNGSLYFRKNITQKKTFDMQFTKTLNATLAIFAAICLFACGEKIKRTPSSTYMPDMYYSRAYETYSSTEYLNEAGIKFNASPVPGTVRRGDLIPKYNLTNDEAGYAASAKVKNPIDSLNEKDMKKAENLYMINCAICHGPKLDGNGPLYKDGDGPYPAKPATLVGDAKYESMPEGTMFHAIQYGRNLMGSYASQLTDKESWMVVKYIKTKQTKK